MPRLFSSCLVTAWRLAMVAALGAASGCGLVARNQNVEGVRYFEQGQLPVAQARFQRALKLNPRSADAYYNLAAVAHKQGLQTRDQNQLAQAEELYNQCLDRNPNHVDCHRGLAVLLTETGRADRAFSLLKNWTVTSPQLADARVELARLYEEYGDARTAELQLQQALQLDLNNARAHAALGRIKEQSGDLPQALANYQRAYSLNTFQPNDLANRIAALKQRVGSSPTALPSNSGVAPLRSAGTYLPGRTY